MSSLVMIDRNILSKLVKKRKITTTNKKNKQKAEKPAKKSKTVAVLGTSSRISDDEDIFFSKILAKKDFTKEKIHRSIEQAAEVMKDAKLEIQKCPFCKKHTAFYNMVQRRSGDEGATAEFNCKNELCGRSWRGR
jgi:DNA-directed RNA polymerase subunit M/transcription elongation factor TFIIS